MARGEKTHVDNTWTKSRYFGFIRSALRSAFNRYPPKFKAKKAAEKTVKGMKHRFEYKCAQCKQWFKGVEVEVDHKVPAGSLKEYDDLGEFCRKLFCEVDDLQVLCKGCHKTKTAQERAARKQDL
jgi:5-methylcytosine-specific restriction endonuclease McrA